MTDRSQVRAEPAAGEGAAPALTIRVVSGIGFGPTKLAAFDAALRGAGIADFNLVYLTSMIPAGSTVVTNDEPAAPVGRWGDRLYVVMAELRVDTRYEEAVAGLGWVQEEETGRGLFVEHVGHTEREVQRDILATLDALVAGRPQTFGAPEHLLRNTACTDEPACALVAAAFSCEPWRAEDEIHLP